MVFAQCIDHNRPDLKIFEYRDGILLKAVSTLLQLAYDGRFMRFNDALLKATTRRSLVYAVNIAYNADPSNKTLLDVAAVIRTGCSRRMPVLPWRATSPAERPSR